MMRIRRARVCHIFWLAWLAAAVTVTAEAEAHDARYLTGSASDGATSSSSSSHAGSPSPGTNAPRPPLPTTPTTSPTFPPDTTTPVPGPSSTNAPTNGPRPPEPVTSPPPSPPTPTSGTPDTSESPPTAPASQPPQPTNGRPPPTAPPPESPSPPYNPSRPTTRPPRPPPATPAQPMDPDPVSPSTPPRPPSPQTPRPSKPTPTTTSSVPEPSNPPSSTNPSSSSETDPLSSPTSTATPTPKSKPYTRGDDVIVVTGTTDNNGTTTTTTHVEVVLFPSQSPALVVRDRDALSAAASADASHVYTFLSYLSSILALESLVVLVVFHFAAVLSSSVSSIGSSPLVAPNQWELLVFITYIQSVASMAHYVVRGAPLFLWEYVDAFSWTVFVPFAHSSHSALPSSSSSGYSNPTRRRLSHTNNSSSSVVVVLDGLVAFADRIGVKETELLQTSVAGWLLLGAVLVLAACGVKLFIYTQQDRTTAAPVITSEESADQEDTKRQQRTQGYALQVLCGMAVILGLFALYPITLMATFEIVSQLRAGQVASGPLAIALVVLLVGCLGFVVRALIVTKSLQKSNQDDDDDDKVACDQQQRIVWGSLCSLSYIHYDKRIWFVSSWLAMQIGSALVVSCIRSPAWQLALLLCMDVAFLVIVLVTRPCTQRLAMQATCVVMVLKFFNTALAFAYLSTSTSSSSAKTVATVWIILNCLVVIGWFARVFGMACRLVRQMWDSHKMKTKNRKITMDSSAVAIESNDTPHAAALYTNMMAQSSTSVVEPQQQAARLPLR